MEELKNMTPVEIKELLVSNTKTMIYNSDLIKEGYDIVFDEFVANENYITEEKKLWDVILMAFYNFDQKTLDILDEKLGWYHLMVWCFKNLKANPEIDFYYSRYFDYHKEKMSAGQMVSKFLAAFIDDLGEIGPDQIVDFAQDLGEQLKKLPNMVKDQLL